MPDQKYSPLRSEEDGEEVSLQRKPTNVSWIQGFGIKDFVINFAIFTAGLIVGYLLNTVRPCGASDQLAQYSLVPCKFENLVE